MLSALFRKSSLESYCVAGPLIPAERTVVAPTTQMKRAFLGVHIRSLEMNATIFYVLSRISASSPTY